MRKLPFETAPQAEVGDELQFHLEQRIRDYFRAHEAEEIDLLSKAVNISSGTLNLTGVREVGRLF